LHKPAKALAPKQSDIDAPKRAHRGFRGTPPPIAFDFDALADSALLSEIDVAAILRLSTNTVASWRQQPTHLLRWLVLPNGFIRYTAAALRAYLAGGKSRRKKLLPPPAESSAAASPPKPKRSRMKADDSTTAQEKA
jgi:hypothetical protein